MKRICEIYDISKDYEMPKGTVLIIVSDIEKDKIISLPPSLRYPNQCTGAEDQN